MISIQSIELDTEIDKQQEELQRQEQALDQLQVRKNPSTPPPSSAHRNGSFMAYIDRANQPLSKHQQI